MTGDHTAPDFREWSWRESSDATFGKVSPSLSRIRIIAAPDSRTLVMDVDGATIVREEFSLAVAARLAALLAPDAPPDRPTPIERELHEALDNLLRAMDTGSATAVAPALRVARHVRDRLKAYMSEES